MKKSVSGIQLAALMFAAICAGHASEAIADEYTIDGGHSSILFRVMHKKSAPFYGRFNAVSGTFSIDADPSKSSFDVTVKTDSIDSNNKKRDGHLKSPDFFNALEFPTLSFKSTKVEAGKEGALKVTGDLTCHGVTKSITIDVAITGSNEGPRGASKGIETIFTIKRSEFGMSYGLEGGMLGDDVKIIVALEGGKEG
ncbi:MAG: polyisoprenoid-binding protein [Phycisphaerae bacterium]|nr:MAG: polyisoprenoid-binding protein [Phycisphaerae bacterium]